jgi:predicted permease
VRAVHLVSTAVLPVVVLLGLGSVLRRRVVTEPAFWRGLEWVTYHVFTPALLVTSIARTDLASIPLGALTIGLTAPALIVAAALVACRRALRADGPQLTSLVQGSIRQNTYIGLVFAAALHGAQGVAMFALAIAVMVPVGNLISVGLLSVYGSGATRQPAREVLTNPMIVSCAVGLALSVLHLGLPEAADRTLGMLAAPALVAGTLAVGAALTFRVRADDALHIAVASGMKLIALPLCAGVIAGALGAGGALLTTIVLVCALPAAPSAYVLAVRMGGDAHLMAAITGVQTVIAIATLPIIVG